MSAIVKLAVFKAGQASELFLSFRSYLSVTLFQSFRIAMGPVDDTMNRIRELRARIIHI